MIITLPQFSRVPFTLIFNQTNSLKCKINVIFESDLSIILIYKFDRNELIKCAYLVDCLLKQQEIADKSGNSVEKTKLPG